MEKIRLVHMGDSITGGQYVAPSKRWTALVEERISEKSCSSGIKVESLNCGVSGETTRMGLERFPSAVQSPQPHVLTLQYGLNDCNCWQTDRGLPRVSEEAFRANLFEMVARARRVGTRQIILSTNHRTLRHSIMVSGEAYEKANARYSEIIREVAADAGVVLCDVRRAFDAYTEQELESLLLPAPDQLHLSVEGNKIYASIVWPLVQEALGAVMEKCDGKPRTQEQE